MGDAKNDFSLVILFEDSDITITYHPPNLTQILSTEAMSEIIYSKYLWGDATLAEVSAGYQK